MNEQKSEYMEWLSNLKVGDPVVVRGHVGGFRRGNLIVRIEGETPKRWKIPYGTLVRKSEGKIIGEYREYINPLTDEVKTEISHRNSRCKLRRYLEDAERESGRMPIENVIELNKLLGAILNKGKDDENNK